LSIARLAAKNGVWLAGFKLISQLFCWVITFMVARILQPEDYGLMAMATLLVGYIEMSSTLGLEAAIIQRKEVTREELSSNFWLCIMMGILFAMIGFVLAYPTAWIFNDSRIIPITQWIAVIFIITAPMTVPFNLLNREMRFKELGMIHVISVLIAGLSMLFMARAGFGVWTLVWGNIMMKSLDMVLVFWVSRWRPKLHFKFNEVRPYLKFGVSIAGSGSMFYVLHACINLIIGKMLGAQALGFYSFAMDLAKLPNDRIMPIIKQISFPVLSRYQDDMAKGQNIYLKINKYIALLVSPVFLGGAFFGDEIVQTFLGEKWLSITFLFQMICLGQFIATITEVNNLFHTSQGRPQWVLWFQVINAVVMWVSVFIAANHSLQAVAIPWVSIYPVLCVGWAWLTIREINISVGGYLKSFIPPFLATLLMMIGVHTLKLLVQDLPYFAWDIEMIFLQEVVLVAILYGLYLSFFEKESLREVRSLFPKFSS
jgi:O-antigen/teichoic acid export membrane protein